MAKKYYVTTPIYYVNDVPHIGHAYTTLNADVIARAKKIQLGEENVFFLVGTDEHGQKVAQAAEEKNQTPKEYVDAVSPRFEEAWKLLNIEPSYFIRTTDPRHENVVTQLLQKVYDAGYIYEGIYEGLYCIGCEKFITENELINGKCPLHPNKEPIYQKEKNYFLKLKQLCEEKIIPMLNKNSFDKEGYHIFPPHRRHEILSRLALGVEDISISRAGVSWGIPVPWDKEQTIYVWVDALVNYYSATKFLKDKEHFWPADLHIVGKDILWFHSVIWQALLIAAEIDLPKNIFGHGFFTIDGQKMSKSIGNVISPKQLVERYGVDGARYVILSAYEFGADGDISLERFDAKYTADLANGLGNLVSRVAAMADKENLTGAKLRPKIDESVIFDIGVYKIDKALNSVWEKVKAADVEINKKEIWALTGEEKNKSLESLIVQIKQIASDLEPFLPETAEKIQQQFTGKIKSGDPLFPRLK